MTEEFAERYGPWALVLGASEGVGEVFARTVAERGVDVVLVARRAAVLDEVAANDQRGDRRPHPDRRRRPDRTRRRRCHRRGDGRRRGWDRLLLRRRRSELRAVPVAAGRRRGGDGAAQLHRDLCAVPSLRRADAARGTRRHRVGVVRRRARRRAEHGRLRRDEGVRHGDGRSAVGRAARVGRRRARPRARPDRHARRCDGCSLQRGQIERVRRPDPRCGDRRAGRRHRARQPVERPDAASPATTSGWVPTFSGDVAQRRGADDAARSPAASWATTEEVRDDRRVDRREVRPEVADVLVRYATGIDRRDWAAVPELLHRGLRGRLRRHRSVARRRGDHRRGCGEVHDQCGHTMHRITNVGGRPERRGVTRPQLRRRHRPRTRQPDGRALGRVLRRRAGPVRRRMEDRPPPFHDGAPPRACPTVEPSARRGSERTSQEAEMRAVVLRGDA